MVEIKGTLECKDCDWASEDEELFMSCPRCKSQRILHIPPHKILLCCKNNPSGHGKSGGKLSNISKKIRDNSKNNGEIFVKLLKLIRSKNKTWTSTEIIDLFDKTGWTDGDVIRTMLDRMVCNGYLKKTFMKGNNYHLYENNSSIIQYPQLKFHRKGKREGIYYCGFDFKLKGKELDSRKIFNKK